METVKRMIDEGIERNVVIYDYAAPVGQITPRLVALMKVIIRQNDWGTLDSIFVDPVAYEQTCLWENFYGTAERDNEGRVLQFTGVHIYPDKTLGPSSPGQLHYEEKDEMRCPGGKRYIVLGVTREGNTILGMI